ncbi:MAG: transglutaminase-like domain-containing protein [Thermoanaerobaculia bacterium]
MTQSGRVLTHPAAARKRFEELARLPDEMLDLVEASLVIALEAYPALDMERYFDQIEAWSRAIRERVVGSHDLERVIEQVNHLLFDEEGFHGEADDYYDPRNAFLNEVLDRHAGLPIALSILYLEISRRIGIEMRGVALPGRFLVRAGEGLEEILVDPFDGGRVLTRSECQSLMDAMYGGAVRLGERHLRPSTRHEILLRVLAHLKALYLSRHDVEGALASVDRILILDDHDPWELRDRGRLAMQSHRYEEAIEFLSRYLDLAPSADDYRQVADEIDYLRSWLERN